MMPYGMEMKIKCPFFLQYSKHLRGNNITLTCEPLEDNLGFDMSLKTAFATEAERRDYMELFCCDQYDQCPMYRAIEQKYERRNHEKKTYQNNRPVKMQAGGKGFPDQGASGRTKHA